MSTSIAENALAKRPGGFSTTTGETVDHGIPPEDSFREILSPDGKRKFVLFGFQNANNLARSVSLQALNSNGGWDSIIGVGYRHGITNGGVQKTESILTLEVINEAGSGCGEFWGVRVRYYEDGVRQVIGYSRGDSFSVAEAKEQMRRNNVPSLNDLPLVIDVNVTVKSFLAQVKNLDFSNPTLIPAQEVKELPTPQ